MSDAAPVDDLAILFPQARIVRVRGDGVVRTVSLLPLRMDVTPTFLHLIREPMPLLMAGQFEAAIESHYQPIRDAVAIGTGLTAADLGAMYQDDFLKLLVAVIEVNLGFFVERVMPLLHNLAALVVLPVGVSPSPDLSAPATALETSAP